MPAATPRLYFQTLCQLKYFGLYINNERRLTLLTMLTMATRSMFFFYFSDKRRKIVEFFALLTTELSSYKMCKVGMLFCTLQVSI